MKHATKNSALVCGHTSTLSISVIVSLDFVIYKTIISSPYCLDYCYKVVEVGNMTTKLCHTNISLYDICHNIPLVHGFIYSKIVSPFHMFWVLVRS